MPTKFFSGNGYNNADYTARAITGSNDGFSDTALVTEEQNQALNDSFRKRVNDSYQTGNNRVMSRINADKFSEFASDGDGYKIVSRYDTVEFYRINLITGEEIMRIGYHASQSPEFSTQMLVWLTEEIVRNEESKRESKTQMILDGNCAYWAKRGDNGKYTPIVIRQTQPKKYKRNRKVW